MTPSTIIAISGPTGSGKTDLSLRLAQNYPIEIVNADSLQVFKYLNIGSAKPTADELKQATHHMIDVLNPDEPMDVAWYAKEANQQIDDILARRKIPIIVGGAGFYLQAISHPPTPAKAPTAAHLGHEEAYRIIQENDPELLAKIHKNDQYRIFRAASLILSGIKPSLEWKSKDLPAEKFKINIFIPKLAKEELNQRIQRRTHRMFDEGLVEETKHVLHAFPGSLSRLTKAIGYRESLLFLDGKVSKEEMLLKIQIATRQYAKRQRTWFRTRQNVQFIPPSAIYDVLSTHLEHQMKAL